LSKYQGEASAGDASSNGPATAIADEGDAHKLPAHIAIVDMKTWRVIRSVESGRETKGVYVLDASTYAPIARIGDVPLAWGIVTFAPSTGSIESR
jgi:hypothetical protein